MKFFKTDQIKAIDAFTVSHEPIDSFALMERASTAFFNEMLPFLEKELPVTVFAGPGNNGGDALVVSRFLLMAGLTVQVYLVNPGKSLSADCNRALEKLKKGYPFSVTEVTDLRQVVIPEKSYIVDGLFGSGLTRPLEGLFAEIVKHINNSRQVVFSIDIPSGLFGEDNRHNNPEAIVKAHYTFSFQFPKLSFLLPENEKQVGDWRILDIGLHPQAIEEQPSSFYYLEEKEIESRLHFRSKFSHKGTYGHAFLIAGSYSKMGAAVLAAKAALKAGCGLLTVHVPAKGVDIMQISQPEAMVDPDADDKVFSSAELSAHFDAVGVGPGLGLHEKSQKGLLALLETVNRPLVLDADALNMLALSLDMKRKLPENTILTPHPKEFDRLTSPSSSGYERLQKQLDFSQQNKVIVILKGANTCISFPDGRCIFNSTGNPGMATAGSGDTLTGIILSLLAQRYPAEEAAVIGVYIHGMAGDLAARKFSQESLLAGDIADSLGDVFSYLKRKQASLN
jgi:NAD(P)H-hydrate epimerase